MVWEVTDLLLIMCPRSCLELSLKWCVQGQAFMVVKLTKSEGIEAESVGDERGGCIHIM